jgi:hypothetical protein
MLARTIGWDQTRQLMHRKKKDQKDDTNEVPAESG